MSSAQSPRQQHSVHTKGSLFGHLFRRAIHLSMTFIPLLWYAYGPAVARFLSLTPSLLLTILLVFTVLAELARLRFGLVLFGQRKYEAKQISAFAWGTFAIIVVLLTSPGPSFSIPLIWSLSLGDPFLGEMRRFVDSVFWVEFAGILFILLIWLICGYWLGISYWWAVLLAPITVFSEWLEIKGVDDNALMVLVPLAVVLLIYSFF